MRYVVVLMLAALPLTPTVATAKIRVSPFGHTVSADCRAPGATQAVDKKSEKRGIHKLGDEPPASQLFAVYRETGGCPAPIVLRKGIGAQPDDKVPVITAPGGMMPVEPG